MENFTKLRNINYCLYYVLKLTFEEYFTIRILVILSVLLFSGIGCIKKNKNNPAATQTSGQTGTDGGSDGGGSSGGGGSTDSVTRVTKDHGVMFITTSTVSGGFAWTGTFPGDITLGDSVCASEATSRGLTGVFKAVVGSTASRNKANSWVLKKSALYKRPDGTEIGTTDSTGSLVFPLTNSIDGTSTKFWTGLTSNSDVTHFDHCGAWNSISGFDYGVYGIGDSDSSAAIVAGTESCNHNIALLCAEMIPRTTTVPAQKSYRKIFANDTAITAGSGLLYADGAKRFDDICQTDADTNGHSDEGYTTYKALVMTNTSTNGVRRRVACSTAYCPNGTTESIGWVLEANKEYRRADKTTVIGTTNASAVFDFPLTNSFTGVNEDYWTGFTDTWATLAEAGDDNCVFFQSKDSSGTSYVGNGAATDSAAINTLTKAFCSHTKKVLCVEQLRTQNTYVDYPGY